MLKSAVIAAVLMIAQPGAGSAQTSFTTTDDLVPVFRVEVWADTVTDFSNRVDAYSELRRRLESRLPDMLLTPDTELRGESRQVTGSPPIARHPVGTLSGGDPCNSFEEGSDGLAASRRQQRCSAT